MIGRVRMTVRSVVVVLSDCRRVCRCRRATVSQSLSVAGPQVKHARDREKREMVSSLTRRNQETGKK